jgi:hypothetical protein
VLFAWEAGQDEASELTAYNIERFDSASGQWSVFTSKEAISGNLAGTTIVMWRRGFVNGSTHQFRVRYQSGLDASLPSNPTTVTVGLLGTDSDSDGIPNEPENLMALVGPAPDPGVSDTDNDGILDGMEIDNGWSPVVADQDLNGIMDGWDDFDGDAQNNDQEADGDGGTPAPASQGPNPPGTMEYYGDLPNLPPQRPDAPSGLEVQNRGTEEEPLWWLTWMDNSADETGFEVQVRTCGTAPVVIHTLPANSTEVRIFWYNSPQQSAPTQWIAVRAVRHTNGQDGQLRLSQLSQELQTREKVGPAPV